MVFDTMLSMLISFTEKAKPSTLVNLYCKKNADH